ncbi:MAG: RusA family crossover junction endodeoxyribonuclease [Selenomonadaceae bacterium]|nr:RusA family crossover junction endodeoxyribonuclease [Selenomonadaceae bacterium]
MYFNIQIDAIPQGRPRFYNKVAVDPPKSRKFKEDLATLLKLQLFEPALHGAIAVTIHIHRNFINPTNRNYGDIDNLAKGILDACNGILWKDDSQIVQLEVVKRVTDSKPYLEIWAFAKE